MISIIIPTYNESGNIVELLQRLFGVMEKTGLKYEIIVVDDNSPDNTAGIAGKVLPPQYGKVIVRKDKKGLSSAVVDGIRLSSGSIVGVMDSDMSHPPELIPRMLRPILAGECELAVGSRYVKGGGCNGWPLKRQITSRVACMLAMPFTAVKDSTSGFFFFKKEIIDTNKINTIGFKIGLEVFVKGRYKTVREIPYVFTDRKAGASKFSTRQILEYLKQLACFI
ncbi:MAG: polyprenol monophosphomannose synthase [Planctomycetes bacterium]|nr:polyprenol monophosphomannose synthase [Planctomycetota bacterium]